MWQQLELEQQQEEKEQEFKIDQSRRKKARTTKKPLVIAGNEVVVAPYAGPKSKLFEGLSFYIMTEQIHPTKKTKAELESLVKANGGKIVQRDSTDKNLVVVADKRLIKVVSLEKRDTNNIVKPMWLEDCIRQHEADVGMLPYLLPFEPNRHMFYLLDRDLEIVEGNVDEKGDSYARDVRDVDEMRKLLEQTSEQPEGRPKFDREAFLSQLEGHGRSFTNMKTYIFSNVRVAISAEDDPAWSLRAQLAANYVRFGGGQVVSDQDAEGITHMVVRDGRSARQSRLDNMARVVGLGWVEKCWGEGTMVDEERYQWG